MGNTIIEITGLTKKYGSVMVVDNLNLDIKEGEIFGLLGPNGAGKSTTIRMILGLTEPTGGAVSVCGLSSTKHPIEVKQKVGYLPEDVGFYKYMSGFDNLMYTARLNKLSNSEAKKRTTELLEMVGLGQEANKKTGAYSRGMKQRLGLADVLMKQPKVIILDEPTLGLDPKGMKELLGQIVELSKQDGITVLFSSHHLHQVQQVCDKVGLFVKGKLIAEGNIQSLSEKLFSGSPIVIEASIKELINKNSNDNDIVNVLKKLNGITDVKVDSGTCFIECVDDVSTEIARTIVDRNLGLLTLIKKEYGLDDIYNKYFEGGINHED
jgi:ABC-2 type transport system ATP-binding protein